MVELPPVTDERVGLHVLVPPSAPLLSQPAGQPIAAPLDLQTVAVDELSLAIFEVVEVRGPWIRVMAPPESTRHCSFVPGNNLRAWGLRPWLHESHLVTTAAHTTEIRGHAGSRIRLRAGAPLRAHPGGGWELLESGDTEQRIVLDVPEEALGPFFALGAWPEAPSHGPSLPESYLPRDFHADFAWTETSMHARGVAADGTEGFRHTGTCYELFVPVPADVQGLGGWGSYSTSCGGSWHCRNPVQLPVGTALQWRDGSPAGETEEPLTVCHGETPADANGLICVRSDLAYEFEASESVAEVCFRA